MIKSVSYCVSQTRQTIARKDVESILKIDPNDPDLPIHISARVKALQIVIQNVGLDDEKREELIKAFKEYLEDVNLRRILLIPKDEFKEDHPALLLRYEVRFNSKRKAKKYKRQYKHFWRETAKRYRWGVVITLTIDPSKVSSIWEARYLAQQEFNRFMTWLKKFLRERAKKYGKDRKHLYVRFIEYQMNGRVHYHIVVFGTRWIKNEVKLAQENWRLGFVDVKTIINVRGKWRFKQKPKDYDEKYRRYLRRRKGTETDGGSPLYATPDVYFYFASNYSGIDDVGKLESFDEYDLLNMALHWVLNTRFWACSKELMLPSYSESWGDL